MSVSGFFFASYSVDGKQVGQGFCHIDKLSPKWIDACSLFLDHHGEVFKASWGQGIGHIATKLTSSHGAGLVIFYVNNEIAVSGLYMSGCNEAVDSQVMDMYIKSLEDTELIHKVNPAPHPFQSIRSLTDRPMVVALVSGNTNIDDSDNEIIQELSTHFAASFFLKNTP